VVEGLNQVKKHISQREAMRLQREPGVTTKDMPIAVSNVMLKDPKTGAPSRIGYQIQADGSKVRVSKKSGTVIDTITKTKKDQAGKKTTAQTSTSAPKAKSKK
jgi:large subunit ribosomal protein L24